MKQELSQKVDETVRRLRGAQQSARQIAEALSRELGRPMTEKGVWYRLRKLHLPPLQPCINLPEEVRAYIFANYRGVGPTEMSERVRDLFGFEYDVGRMGGFYDRHGLKCGLTGRFEKGFSPWNKGRKGWSPPGTEHTRFRKGNRPGNWRPVGSERLNKDGYVEVKVAEPRKWRLKHLVVYEEHFGKIPKGCTVVFLDRNRQNFDPANLRLMTRADLAVLNRSVKLSDDPEINEVKLNVVKLIRTASKVSKRRQHD